MPFRGEGMPLPPEAMNNQEQTEGEKFSVPEAELQIEFVRSSGPGGQNVNKTSTKAQLRWDVGGSSVFSEEQKAAIRIAAGNRLNKEDEIVLFDQTQRSQSQNRVAVIERLQTIVDDALLPKKERIETRVSYGQKQRRLDDKRRQSERKQSRSSREDW